LDTLPPATLPHEPPPYVYGPNAIYPLQGQEKELCDRASHPDWLYLGALAAIDVGSLWFLSATKYDGSEFVRTSGAAGVGLAWGATLGGGYLALAKCDPNWVSFPPREGGERASWPLAVTFAGLSAITAPFIMGIATGPLPVPNGSPPTNPQGWSTTERAERIFVSGAAGIVGALLPYVISPSTWSAARELEKIRADVTPRGAFVSYGVRF
jgi:hypothetical protein